MSVTLKAGDGAPVAEVVIVVPAVLAALAVLAVLAALAALVVPAAAVVIVVVLLVAEAGAATGSLVLAFGLVGPYGNTPPAPELDFLPLVWLTASGASISIIAAPSSSPHAVLADLLRVVMPCPSMNVFAADADILGEKWKELTRIANSNGIFFVDTHFPLRN